MNRYGVVGVVMLVVGATAFFGGIYVTLQQEQGLTGTDQTEGTVLSTSLEPAEGDEFYSNVTYTYTVEGTTYTSNRIFPDETRRPAPRPDAEEVVNRYREGQTVTVYFPGDDPSRASLRAPRSPVPIFAFGLGFVLAAFGLVFYVAGRQGGMDPIETDEVTLVDREPTPRSETEGGDAGDAGEAESPDGSGDDGEHDAS